MAISLPIVSKFDDKGIQDAQLKIGAFQGIAAGAFAKIGSMAVEAFAAASQAAIRFGANSVKAAAEAEAVTRQLENAAKNSGAFGDTAESIKLATAALDKHSTALAELSGIDDETINKLKSRWMTVPGIVALGTDGINNLATVSADVAAATGKDIESIGLMFTKVAGDSETALSKLTRAGIVLTDEQKKTYQSLIDTNKEAEAQAFLIDALGKKYAGSAQAMANPLARIKVIFENLQETIGKAFLPVLEKLVPALSAFITAMVATPEFQAFVDGLAQVFLDLFNAISPLLPDIMKLIQELLPPMMEIIKALAPVVGELFKAFTPLVAILAKLAAEIIVDVVKIIGELVKLITDNPNFLDGFVKSFKVLETVIAPVKLILEAIVGFLKWINDNQPEYKNKIEFIKQNPLSATELQHITGIAATQLVRPSGKLPGQAEGGITTRGGLSWVGEKGPELLNLPTGAQVIPLDRMGTGGGNTINISVNAGMGADGAALGESIVNAIRRYERTSGAVFAKA